jgi:NADH-quinone oxidoreductase subunit G
MADNNRSSPSQPARVETFTVKVDGREVTVPRTHPDLLTGQPVPTTMIEACAAAGVAVPHYCYHPRLPVVGSCRMCLVEFGLPALGPDRQPMRNPDGSLKVTLQTLPYEPATPRSTIACATPVTAGMEIYTDTPTVKKTREAVLESLLINHPLDCPICDEAGECQLQEYAFQHGPARSQFVETKVHKPKQVDLGPRIVLDDERCILCSRCIRFTRDIVGDDALGIVERGANSSIATYPGRAFDNNYTLNTVDLCPVGALTSKDFRFRMRVWFLKRSKSLCTSCGTGCNIIIGSREERIYRYTPRDNEAVNRGWMCDAGRLNYRWIGREDRLRQVELREPGGDRRTVAWSDAVASLCERLRGAASGSVALVASARQTTEELWLLKKIADRCGALTDAVPRFGEPDRLLVSADLNPNSQGARLTGIAGPELGARLARIAEAIAAGHVRTLLVWGEDVTRHGLKAELLEPLDWLVASDILPNATTARARLLLPGCAHAEKRGSYINVKGRVQRFGKAVEPPGHARPEAEVLAEVVAQLTGERLPDSMEALFNRMAGELPGLRGVTWAALGDQGVTVPV